jgi:hypothetical protein
MNLYFIFIYNNIYINMDKNKIYLYKINKYKDNDNMKYNKYLNKYNSNGGGFFDLFKKNKK